MANESDAIWAVQGFDGGLVTSAPAHSIDDDCSPDAENFDPSFWFGLKKRKGYSNFTGNHATPTGTRVRGLGAFVYENGTQLIVAKEGTAVYNITAGNWSTTITGHPALSDGDEVHFAMFKNLLIMTSEEAAPIAPQKRSDGGSFSNLGGSPPAAQYLCVHKGRLILANTVADPSRVYFSALNNAEDWTTPDNATNLFVHPGDGMVINGVVSDGSVLYVSKIAPGKSHGALYAILGNGPADFQPPVRIAWFGAASQRALAFTHTFVVAAGRKGVWGLRVGEPLIRLSVSIQTTLDNLTDAEVATMCAGPLRDQVWVSHDIGGVTKSHVVDTFFQRWSRYNPTPFRILTAGPDGSLYGASNTSTIRVMKLDDGVTDLGTAITMYWKLKNLSFGKWFSMKRWVRSLVHVANQAITWTLTRFVDDVQQSGSNTFIGNSGDVVHRTPGKGADKQGRFLSFKLEESSSSLQGELYGIEVEADFEGATQRG